MWNVMSLNSICFITLTKDKLMWKWKNKTQHIKADGFLGADQNKQKRKRKEGDGLW